MIGFKPIIAGTPGPQALDPNAPYISGPFMFRV